MAVSQNGGEFLVKLARDSMNYYLRTLVPLPAPKVCPPELKKNLGAFCTLLTYPERELRGCIGMIIPEKNLVETIIEMSCASTQDPRFLPLHPTELESTTVEVTILGDLEKINVTEPRDYLKEIVIGRDGLFLQKGFNSGVFLPQVPVEQGWDIKTYLNELCRKAWLDRDAWVISKINLSRFQAQIFAESEPCGSIYEKKIGPERSEE